MDKEAFGAQLLVFLKRIDMGRSGLARGLRVSPATVTQWVQGKTQPDRKHLARLVLRLYVTRGPGCSAEGGAFRSPWEVMDWVRLLGYEVEDLAACVAETFAEEDRDRGALLKWLNSGQGPLVDVRAQGVHLPSWYVERPAEMDQVKSLLTAERGYRAPANRRVVLWGMGGIGKTVLAKAMALEVGRYFRSGVLWAELGLKGDARRWLEQWCKLLSLPLRDDETVWELHQRVRDHLRDAEYRFLLVIDDVWRAEDLEPLLVDGPQSRVLITARERALASKLDHLMVIVPLEVMTQEEGLALVRQHTARRWREKGAKQQAEVLLELVERLPLAIALAADVVNSRGWDYALKRLQDESLRLGLLEKDKAERREHGVRLAFNVSYEAQPVADQQLFRWVSVFPRGGDFAPLVVSWLLSEENVPWMEERLRRLCDRSLLLLSHEDQRGAVRFRLHVLLQDYGRERLRAAGEWDVVRERYVALYVQWADQWQRRLGTEGHDLAREWRVEVYNVTQALSYAVELGWWNDGAALVDRVAIIARLSGQIGLLDNWLSWLERKAGLLHDALRSRVVKARVEWAVTIRRWDEVIAKGQKAVRDGSMDVTNKGYVWLSMALARRQLGDGAAARGAWQEGWKCIEGSNDPYLYAAAVRVLGDMMLAEGRPAEAIQVYFEAEKAYLRLERGQEDLVDIYTQIGRAYYYIGEKDLSLRVFWQAMTLSLELGWSPLIFQAGHELAMLAVMTGKLEEAKDAVVKLEQVLPQLVDIEPLRSQHMGLFCQLKGGIQYAEGNYEEAVKSMDKAWVYLEAGGVDEGTLGSTRHLLGEIRLAMGDYVLALETAQQAKALYERAGAWEEARQAAKLMEQARQGMARDRREPE